MEPKEEKKPARPKLIRKLTLADKAEAAALWRSGSVTLEDLAKKFKRRPETFSRLFKKMGIEKGAAVADAAKRMAEEMEARAVTATAEELKRIATAKDEHFKIATGLAKLAWAEIVRARQAEIPLATLKDTMATLKLASEVTGNARKELWAILRVEEHDSKVDEDELPELQVRELSQDQIDHMQAQPLDFEDGMGLDDDADDDVVELGGPGA